MAGPFSELRDCLKGASDMWESADCYYDAAKRVYDDFSSIAAPIGEDNNDDNQLPDKSFADFTQGVYNVMKTGLLIRKNEKLMMLDKRKK